MTSHAFVHRLFVVIDILHSEASGGVVRDLERIELMVTVLRAFKFHAVLQIPIAYKGQVAKIEPRTLDVRIRRRNFVKIVSWPTYGFF